MAATGMRMCAASAKKRRGEGSGVASARCACWRCEQTEGTVARVGAQLRGGMMAANAPMAVLRPQRAGTEPCALGAQAPASCAARCICPCLPLGHTQSRAATDCRKPSCHAAATHCTTRQHDAGTTHGSARAHTHDTRARARARAHARAPARAIALRLAAHVKLCRHTTLTLAAGAGLGVSAAAAPCAPTTQAAAAMASSACASAWACLHHDHCILRGHASERACRRQAFWWLRGTTVRPGVLCCGAVQLWWHLHVRPPRPPPPKWRNKPTDCMMQKMRENARGSTHG